MPKASRIIAHRYGILRELGTGGMGAVYEVVDYLSGTVMAMKTLHKRLPPIATPTLTESIGADLALANEFQFLTAIRHPNIVTVYDFGMDGRQSAYFTLELLQQPVDVVSAFTDRSLSEKIHALIQILQALTYLHQCDILHGDLKPSNILTVHGDHVKLVDFGLAGRIGNVTQGIGTLAYLAPECIRHHPRSQASDLYALGLVAYEMISARFPFNVKSLGRLVHDILYAEIDLPLDSSEGLRTLLRRWLAKDPSERYSDARSIIHDLCEATGIAVPGESLTIQASFLRASRFVGREGEIAALRRALDDLRLGDGSAWLISGVSGIGKSRLLAEIRTYALLQNIHVIRVDAADGSIDPFHLLRQILQPLLPVTTLNETEASILKFTLPELNEFLDMAVSAAPDMGVEMNRQQLADTLFAMLSRQQTPLFLFEDLHGALDQLHLIGQLAQMTENREMMIVCSYRSDDSPDLQPALPMMRQIVLNPLPRQQVERLVEYMLGTGSTHQHFVDAVAAYAEGNVFFIVDLLQDLAQKAHSLTTVGQLVLDADLLLSPGVIEIAQRRLQNIPERFHRVLYAAAVLGRELDLPLLGYIAPHLLEDERWLSLCASCGILRHEHGRWQFDHDKIRIGLLQKLSALEHSDLHRTAAEALEAVYPGKDSVYPRLLHHWRQVGDIDKEKHYLVLVARRLSEHGYPMESQKLVEAAIPRFEQDNAFRIQLYYQLALSYKLQGEYDRSIQVAQMGEQLAAQLELIPMRRNFVSMLGALAREQGDFRLADLYQQRSLDMAEALGDRIAVAQSLLNLASAKASLGELDRAETLIQQAYSLAESLNHPLGSALTALAWANVARYRGEHASALAYFERCLIRAREHDFAFVTAQALNGLGVLYADQGHPESAIAAFEESAQISRRIGEQRVLAMSLTLEGLIRARNGMTDAEEALRTGLQLANTLHLTPTILVALIGFAHLEAARGNPGITARVAHFLTGEDRLLAYNRDHLDKLIAVVGEQSVRQAADDYLLEQWIAHFLNA